LLWISAVTSVKQPLRPLVEVAVSHDTITGTPTKEVRSFSTMTADLMHLADWRAPLASERR
jgi:hypothetical protein